MKEEIIEKILRKMKETVSENNYKLALAITGHRLGKIRDVLMSSKDGETLLEYIENLQSQLKAKEEVIKEAREYIEKYDVFKEFYFPLMKRDVENQIKSSIKYEFDTSIKKNLLEILSKGENK